MTVNDQTGEQYTLSTTFWTANKKHQLIEWIGICLINYHIQILCACISHAWQQICSWRITNNHQLKISQMTNILLDFYAAHGCCLRHRPELEISLQSHDTIKWSFLLSVNCSTTTRRMLSRLKTELTLPYGFPGPLIVFEKRMISDFTNAIPTDSLRSKASPKNHQVACKN